MRARPWASSASTFGLRCPAISASIIARPDTPSTSVSTEEILIRASSSSFSIRCLTRVRSSTRSKRARARSRTRRIGSAGTSDGDSIDRSASFASHTASILSVFGRPGTFFTCAALTSHTVNPAASSR